MLHMANLNKLDIRARTPARILVPRAGVSYATATQLDLRADHAAARDAVQAELTPAFLKSLSLPCVTTQANSKAEYLLRPDLGRRLSADSRSVLMTFSKSTDLQIAVGDGLSARAVEVQVPALLPGLLTGARHRGWSVGMPFALRYCRVGVMNDIGDVLDPAIVVLLIGERPGLATAESLSAYIAYHPQPGDTDAKRNLVSNIHARGVSCDEAVKRVLSLAETMMRLRTSGVAIKESLPVSTRRELPSAVSELP